MIRALRTTIVLLFAAALSCAAAWDGMYEGDTLPETPPFETSEVTQAQPGDVREIIDIGSGNNAFHIVDGAASRARYGISLGSGIEAGTIETRQRFISSSDMNNIALVMRQDTPGASAEIRVGYRDAGDGRSGLWDAKSGRYLGPTNPNTYYKFRMILDGPNVGRLYVDDSYFADLTATSGASSRVAFGAGSTLGTGEVFIDYFKWKAGAKAAPGDASTPTDLISPRTTSLPAVVADLTSANVTWTTDVPSDSTVRWSTTADTTWTFPNTTYDASLVTSHNVTINGLQNGSTYRFYVESRVSGDPDVARSGIHTFTTDDIFRISSGPFVRIGSDGTPATVTWSTTFPSDSSTLFVRQKGSSIWTQTAASHGTLSSAGLAGLNQNSAYEFYVVSSKSGWPDAQSSVAEFFTYTYSSPIINSLLKCGDFEPREVDGTSWAAWWKTTTESDVGVTHPGPWFDRIMPHSANNFLGLDSNGGERNGTIYQSVSDIPESDYIYASVWIYTCELDAFGTEEHNSSYCRIGLDVTQDPMGQINPDASSILWSTPTYTVNDGPWKCISVVLPRLGSTYATIFLRHIQTADGGLNVTCFDDAALSTTSPVRIISGPSVTALTATSATIEWATDVESSSLVEIGEGTTGSYTLTDRYEDATPTTDHSLTVSTLPLTDYVFIVSSASELGAVTSEPQTFATPISDTLLNPGFEDTDLHGAPRLAPWTTFQYDINQIPRLSDPGGQPAGGPIDGFTGPHPYGDADWNGITCEPGGGSYFIGAFADGTNKNGGVYQRVAATPGQVYRATTRFLTGQQPIDGSHPASNTACAIAIDPMGGTNVLSSSLIWSFDRTSSVNGQWDEVSVLARAQGSVITVFCVVEQRYTNSVHLNALDNVTLESSQPVSGHLSVLKQQHAGTPVTVGSKVLTYRRIPVSTGTTARLYVEESDRSAAIGILSTDPVLWSSPPSPGDTVTATGTLTVVAGEALVQDAALTITPGSPSNVPAPLLITQRHLGGGTYGIQPGVTDRYGLSNIGFLAKLVGRVTSGDFFGFDTWMYDPSWGGFYAYIDDGSGLQDGSGYGGVKIMSDTTIEMQRNDMLTAIGVVSVEKLGSAIRPILLIGDASTIEVVPP